jgi:hypothetical protein
MVWYVHKNKKEDNIKNELSVWTEVRMDSGGRSWEQDVP